MKTHRTNGSMMCKIGCVKLHKNVCKTAQKMCNTAQECVKVHKCAKIGCRFLIMRTLLSGDRIAMDHAIIYKIESSI